MMRPGMATRGPTPGLAPTSGAGDTTQHGALSSRGGITQMGGDQQLPETAERLLAISPDSWRNIAFCVVNAFKILIDDQIQQEVRLRQSNSSLEELRKKTMFMLKRVEKDLNKKEENFLAQIDRVQKNMTGAFNKLRIEVENSLQKNDLKVDQSMRMVESSVEKMEEKIAKIQDSEVVKAYARDQVNIAKGELTDKIQESKELLSGTINELAKNNLLVPDLVGEDEMFPNMKVYVQETYKDFSKKLQEFQILQAQVEPYMDKSTQRLKLLEGDQKMAQEKAKVLQNSIKENKKNFQISNTQLAQNMTKFKQQVIQLEKSIMSRQQKMLAEHKSGLDQDEIQEIVDEAANQLKKLLEEQDKSQQIKEMKYSIEEKNRQIRKVYDEKTDSLEQQIIQLAQDMQTPASIEDQVNKMISQKLQGEVITQFQSKIDSLRGELIEESSKNLEVLKQDMNQKFAAYGSEFEAIKTRPGSVMSNKSKKELQAKLNEQQIAGINEQILELGSRINDVQTNFQTKLKQLEEVTQKKIVQSMIAPTLIAPQQSQTITPVPKLPEQSNQSKEEIEKAEVVQDEEKKSEMDKKSVVSGINNQEIKNMSSMSKISQQNISKQSKMSKISQHTPAPLLSSSKAMIKFDPQVENRLAKLQEEFRKLALHLPAIQQMGVGSGSRQAIIFNQTIPQVDGQQPQLSTNNLLLPDQQYQQQQHIKASMNTLSGGQQPSLPQMLPLLPEQIQIPIGQQQQSQLKDYIQQNVSPMGLKYQQDVANMYKMPYILNQFHTTPHTLIQRERIPIKVDFQPLEGLDQHPGKQMAPQQQQR